MKDHSELRKELRRFHNREGTRCTDPERLDFAMDMRFTMEEYAVFNPEADALDFRRENHLLMRRRIRPVLFSRSPFYFELGGNGGWNGTAPGRWVLEHLSKRVFADSDPEAWSRHTERVRKNFYQICSQPQLFRNLRGLLSGGAGPLLHPEGLHNGRTAGGTPEQLAGRGSPASEGASGSPLGG